MQDQNKFLIKGHRSARTTVVMSMVQSESWQLWDNNDPGHGAVSWRQTLCKTNSGLQSLEEYCMNGVVSIFRVAAGLSQTLGSIHLSIPTHCTVVMFSQMFYRAFSKEPLQFRCYLEGLNKGCTNSDLTVKVWKVIAEHPKIWTCIKSMVCKIDLDLRLQFATLIHSDSLYWACQWATVVFRQMSLTSSKLCFPSNF